MYAPFRLGMDAPPLTWTYGDLVQLVEAAKRAWEWARSLPLWVLDAVLTFGFLPVAIISVESKPLHMNGDYMDINALGILLVIGAVLPLLLRRRYPLPVFFVSTGFLMVFAASNYFIGAVAFATLIALYTVGTLCRPRELTIAFVTLVLCLMALLIIDIPDFTAGDALSNLALYTVALLFGWTVQARRLRLADAEERAEIIEREQEEERARAIAQERLHIAQELHDVMAHSMSVIAVQAGVGMHVVEQDPTEAKKALENISTTSRSTLVELRRMLGVLREDDAGTTYVPAPGLSDLDKLAQEVTDAGIPVSVTIEGPLVELPAGVDLTGFRIVQEALTNVLKHAGPSNAWVGVSHRDGTLHIEVRDDGRGVNGRSSGMGHGLTGMRERVAVYGGELHAGPVPGGGFRVVADLPYATDGERE
jgi:signal transduction histidine kinase